MVFLLYYLFKDKGEFNMYNNDINNNFNNNEAKSFFENDLNSPQGNVNNISTSSNFQATQDEIQNKFQNVNSYEGQLYNQNNIFQNDFSTSNINMYDNPSPSVENSNLLDIPPELGEIKNLSEATIASAPTMNVLNPMNVMPEVTKPADTLDNYENGNLNNFNELQPLFEINSPINNQYSKEPNQQQNSIPLETFKNNESSNFIPNFNTIPSSVPENTFSSQIPEQIKQTSQFNNYEQEFNINNNFDMNKEQNTNLLPPKNEVEENINNSQQYTLIQKSLNGIPSFENYDKTTDELNSMTNSNPLALEKNEDYAIIQDSKLNDNFENKSSSSDLKIENVYDEPDTLDIIDINDDESNPKDKLNSEEFVAFKSEQGLSINDVVLKVKELVENLKNQGVNIQLEEFDFDKLRQLIIKIEE